MVKLNLSHVYVYIYIYIYNISRRVRFQAQFRAGETPISDFCPSAKLLFSQPKHPLAEGSLGRVYCHVVMLDSPNKGLPCACLPPCCDVGFIEQRVTLGVFTTML